MLKEFFKSALGIGILIVISLGILGIVGYNFWGWFGGSAKWKAEHPDTSGSSGGTGGETEETDRIMNFSSDTIGLQDASADQRQAISTPSSPISRYKLCYTRIAIMNKGAEPLSVWQAMVTNLIQDIQDKVKKAQSAGHQIAITIIAPQIIPGAPIAFYVYAGDCNSKIALEAINYIKNLN